MSCRRSRRLDTYAAVRCVFNESRQAELLGPGLREHPSKSSNKALYDLSRNRLPETDT